MFIELTTIIDGDEERAFFNINHIVMVRQKDDHVALCFQQTNFTMLEVKEDYKTVTGLIEDLIELMRL